MMDRAYSILDIKSVKEDERIIKGIASTPSTDRMGDIVESEGAKFKLPMPLLWQHNSREPVGWVTAAKPTKNGIPFEARFAKIDEPGELSRREPARRVLAYYRWEPHRERVTIYAVMHCRELGYWRHRVR